MLKKAGIVVAAGAASLVAMSPLAFASDGDSYKAHESFNPSETTGSYNKNHEDTEGVAQKNSSGLVNLSNNNVNVSPQTCSTAFNGNSLIQGALGGLMSEAENKSGVESDNSVDCTNAAENGDQVDIDTEDGEHQGGGKGHK